MKPAWCVVVACLAASAQGGGVSLDRPVPVNERLSQREMDRVAVNERLSQREMDQVPVNELLSNPNLPHLTPVNERLSRRELYHLAAVNERLTSLDFSPSSVYQALLDVITRLKAAKEWIPCTVDLVNVLRASFSAQMWALKMIDSGTKVPSGLLAGNIVDLGQYDECVNSADGNITGQHCLISFTFHLPQSDEDGLLKMLGGSLTVTTAQCFPASCTPPLLTQAYGGLADALSDLLSSMNVSVTADVPATDCHTSKASPLDPLEIAVLFIIILLLLISSASTVMDYLLIQKNTRERKPTSGEVAVQAFSFYTNGRKLFSLKKNKEQMNCINGMKFLSIGWVALGHRYRYAVTVPLVNLLSIPDMIQSWSKMVLLNAILSVDTFFLVSGLLNAYGLSTLLDKSRRFGLLHILHLYLHRFIRLTPSYLLMIAMTATWLYRVGDGPIWDRLVGSARDNCRQSWWANVLYINNYVTIDRNCMMQSWYLAADMQMFVVGPFVIYPLWRWPVAGYILLLVLGALSAVSPFCVAYFYDITTPVPVTTDPVEQSKEMDKLYFPTHTKTMAYVVGIYVGYLLYRIRVKKNFRFRPNLVTNLVGWAVAMASMLYALFGGHPLFLSSHPYTLVESSLYIGFYRLFWSVGVGWVILACAQGYGGIVNSFLSLEIFGPLGRLTYCIYLTHVFMILYKMGSMRTAIYFSDYDMLQESLGEMIIIIFFATLVSLTTEAPIITLEKLVFGAGRKKGGGGPGGREAVPSAPEAELGRPLPPPAEPPPVQWINSPPYTAQQHRLSRPNLRLTIPPPNGPSFEPTSEL